MEPVLRRFRAMGSPCEIQLRAAGGEAIAAAAVAEVERLERKYSRYRDDSLATRINRSAGDPVGVEVDDETAGLLDYAEQSWRQSDGLFDPTSGVLRRVWDLKSGRLPSAEAVEAVREYVGWEKLCWRRPRLVLPRPGMELDFGGFVKEYAADRAAELCRRLSARHGLVNLGGDLAIVGPHPGGAPWRVGVADPRRRGESLACIGLVGGAIATSGDAERCMWVDGRRYGHLLDPRSGWPVEGLASVSVVASHCLIAGTLSTIAMLKGRAGGPAWLDGLGLPTLQVAHDGTLGGQLGVAAG